MTLSGRGSGPRLGPGDTTRPGARRRGAVLGVLAAVLVAAACGSPAPPGTPGATDPGGESPPTPSVPAEETTPPSGATPTPGRTPAPSEPAARPPQLPEDVWRAVLADLETRTHHTEHLTVITAEAVTWNDASLGCPEPGMVYTQALVDGYHVVLDVGGQQYDYRVGGGPAVKLCASSNAK